ncbi:MAG: nuclear transport factor 2 family protein [Clostridia bacterium]|nr:nuclear transport factor 2 family protein [Clostridia bacterium]NCC76249.1 nuclear transport factor 2 family protein [Clostridia bacterium]
MPELNTDPVLPPAHNSRLTLAEIKDLWSRTYNTDGKPDWSHLFPYYHPQIIFQDSIQRIEGMEAFQAMCKRLTDRCQSLRMDILSMAENGPVVLMDWQMTMAFKKYPDTPVYGATKLTFNDEGLIIEQRDYYDLWGDIFNGIPRFNQMYRRFMHKKFG